MENTTLLRYAELRIKILYLDKKLSRLPKYQALMDTTEKDAETKTINVR